MHPLEVLWVVFEGGMLVSVMFLLVAPVVWLLLASAMWLVSRVGPSAQAAPVSGGVAATPPGGELPDLRTRNLAIAMVVSANVAVAGFALGNLFAMAATLPMFLADVLGVVLIARLTSAMVRRARGLPVAPQGFVTTYAVLIGGNLAAIALGFAVIASYQNVRLW